MKMTLSSDVVPFYDIEKYFIICANKYPIEHYILQEFTIKMGFKEGCAVSRSFSVWPATYMQEDGHM